MNNNNKYKIIISGGGTGGHIFPAIAIANALKKLNKNIEILFVGALGKMEMEKIPQAGYKIIGLPIQGINRKQIRKNFLLPIKILKSLIKAKKIINEFKPDLVIGTGGYASWPLLFVSAKKNIPIYIQEQNSYAGVSNKFLSKYAKKIFVAYPEMEKYFPKEKIILSGNPIRQDIKNLESKRIIALKHFFNNESTENKTILILGGSLGAKSINIATENIIPYLKENNFQVIWQTGNLAMKSKKLNKYNSDKIIVKAFIKEMDLAYAAADIIISRAGAVTISELCVAGKATILVPSPNVAEDHQRKNALALVKNNAAIMIEDKDLITKLKEEIKKLISNEELMKQLSQNIKKIAKINADEIIAKEIIKETSTYTHCLPTQHEKFNKVFMLGIGGIGMSALAEYFNYYNYLVGGYDKTRSKITEKLNQKNIFVTYNENIKEIPHWVKNNDTLIVYTPAISKENILFNYFKKNNFKILKRSEILGEISKKCTTVAIAGTHGKTTISTLISFILYSSGKKIISFLGGISKNFNSNFIITDNPELMIVEADEYDKSFLKLYPDYSVINSIDPDHLDIYKNYENLHKTYQEFASLTKKHLILNYNISNLINDYSFTYSFKNNSADYFSYDIKINNGKYTFNVKTPANEIKNIESQIPGKHNIENILAAISVAKLFNISNQDIKKAISNFKGVERRMDIRINSKSIVYIDDYAHHPVEIKSVLLAVREMYPNKKITVFFQPHLYSRTYDFADEFALSLSLADEIFLLEIYPAREKAQKNISSNLIKEKINNKYCSIIEKKDIIKTINNLKTNIILTLGAGDIADYVEKIEKTLLNKIK